MENDTAPPSQVLDLAAVEALVPTKIEITKEAFLNYLQPFGGVMFLEKLLPAAVGNVDGELPPQFKLVMDTLRGAESCWFSMGVGKHEGWRIEVTGDGATLPPELFGGAFVDMLDQMTMSAQGETDPSKQMVALLAGFLGGGSDPDDEPPIAPSSSEDAP